MAELWYMSTVSGIFFNNISRTTSTTRDVIRFLNFFVRWKRLLGDMAGGGGLIDILWTWCFDWLIDRLSGILRRFGGPNPSIFTCFLVFEDVASFLIFRCFFIFCKRYLIGMFDGHYTFLDAKLNEDSSI